MNKLLVLGVPAVMVCLIALGSAPAYAAPAIHCVPDALIDASCTDGHATIQAAVNHAATGDTVLVGAGTYTATSLDDIIITTNGLSLVGQSRDGTIIDAGTQSSGRGIHVYANDVTIRDLTVQDFTDGYGIVFRDWAHDQAGEGYIFYSGDLVDNVKLDNNGEALYALVHQHLTVSNSLIQNSSADGMFIARESDYATVTGNTVLNSANQGIWVGYDWSAVGPSDNATITDNLVDGAVEGGISFVHSDTALISGNRVTHVKGEEPEGAFGGWSRGAISLKDGVSNVTVSQNEVYENDGLGTGSGRGIGVDGTSSNISIVENNIRDNAGGGIKVLGTTSGWSANNNCIHGNTGYGAQNTTGSTLNFENNWWGDSSGPSGSGPGSGDAVSTNVDFDPWLTAPASVCAPPTPTPTPPPGVGGTIELKSGATAPSAQQSDSAALPYAALALAGAAAIAVASGVWYARRRWIR